MAYQLSVDLGTTFTAAAVRNGSGPVMVGLGNRALQVPSVLFRVDDGFVVGETAERRGATEPGRLVREFKRRLGDHIPMLVDGAPYSAEALTAHLLRWVIAEVAHRQGEPASGLVLTHPANWGPYKLDVLRQVVTLADAGPARWCTEPLAAAAQYAAQARVEVGDRLAVYDLGGGTFDACVLEKTPGGFTMLGTPEGVEHLGGVDFDEALFRQVVAGLGERAADLDPADAAAVVGLARLRRECVEAKEALSTEVDTVIPVALPGLVTTVRVTRADLEALVRPPLEETVAALQRAVRAAGLEPAQLSGIVLVGGSSRIPLVGEMLQRRLGVATALDTHPKHDVALGALQVADETPQPRTGAAARPPVVPQPEPEPEPDPDSQRPPEPTVPTSAKPSRGRKVLLAGAAATLVAATVVTLAVRSAGHDTSGTPSLAPVLPTPSPSATPSVSTVPQSVPIGDDQLVVSMKTGGSWNLYLASTGGGLVSRRLVSGPADDFVPVLSLDRRTIIYQHDADPKDQRRTLRVAGAADGSGARELFARTPSWCDGTMYRPAWSPVDPTLLAVPCRSTQGRYGLYLVRTDGTLVEKVPIDGDRADDPTFAPDGRLVFWAGPLSPAQLASPSLADGRLYVRATDGAVTRLPGVGGTGRDADPAFSPDGLSLAFRRRAPDGTRAGNLDVYVMPADGSAAPRLVARGPRSQEEDPTWSPDGTRIAFKSNARPPTGGAALPRTWVVAAEGATASLLIAGEAEHEQTAPAWTRR